MSFQFSGNFCPTVVLVLTKRLLLFMNLNVQFTPQVKSEIPISVAIISACRRINMVEIALLDFLSSTTHCFSACSRAGHFIFPVR